MTLIIDPETYRANPTHRALADQVMTAHGLDPMDVVQIDLTEADSVVWTYVYPHVAVYPDGGPLKVRRRYRHPSHASGCRPG